jgi:hypothetical protein
MTRKKSNFGQNSEEALFIGRRQKMPKAFCDQLSVIELFVSEFFGDITTKLLTVKTF